MVLFVLVFIIYKTYQHILKFLKLYTVKLLCLWWTVFLLFSTLLFIIFSSKNLLYRYSFHHIIFFPNSFYLLTQTLAYHSPPQFSVFPPSPLIHLLSLRGFDISVKHFLMEETKFQASRKNVTKIYPPISKPISGLSVQS